MRGIEKAEKIINLINEDEGLDIKALPGLYERSVARENFPVAIIKPIKSIVEVGVSGNVIVLNDILRVMVASIYEDDMIETRKNANDKFEQVVQKVFSINQGNRPISDIGYGETIIGNIKVGTIFIDIEI